MHHFSANLSVSQWLLSHNAGAVEHFHCKIYIYKVVDSGRSSVGLTHYHVTTPVSNGPSIGSKYKRRNWKNRKRRHIGRHSRKFRKNEFSLICPILRKYHSCERMKSWTRLVGPYQSINQWQHILYCTEPYVAANQAHIVAKTAGQVLTFTVYRQCQTVLF